MLRSPMKNRLPSRTEMSSAPSRSCLDDLAILLDEIEREEVPERLLLLARQLQAALAAKRGDG
jgi:hypothetical protein